MKIIPNNIVWSTYLKRTELKEFQWDLKKDNKSEIKQLSKRIKKGFDAPIFVWYENDNYILDGHQRLKALNELQSQWYMLEDDKIPVVYIKADSIEEAKAKVAEYNSKYSDINTEFAMDRFKWVDMEWIMIPNFNFMTDEDEVKKEKEDVIPVIETEPIVKQWDIFRLDDNHYIMCWDSTLSSDVDKLLNWIRVDMIRTDPPYNVAYHWYAENTKEVIMNDKMDKESFQLFLDDAFVNLSKNIKQGGGIYIRHNHKEQIAFQKSIEKNWMEIKQQIIRNKPSLWLWAWDYRPKHEVCFYACIKWSKTIFYWMRDQATVQDLFKNKSDQQILWMIKASRKAEKEWKTTILSIRRDNTNEYVHPTQKPVELCEVSMNNSSKQWDIVMDLFLWSWVCLITCEKHWRTCYWMELDPKYIEVILKRYYEYTNKSAKIECINRSLELTFLYDK